VQIFFQGKALLLPDGIRREWRRVGNLGNHLENKGLFILLFSKVPFTNAPTRSETLLKIWESAWLGVWQYSAPAVHVHSTIKNKKASWNRSRGASGALSVLPLQSKSKEIFLLGGVSQLSQADVWGVLRRFPIWWTSKIKKPKWKTLKNNFTLDKIFLELDQSKTKSLAYSSDPICTELQGLICIIYMEKVPRNQFGTKYLHYVFSLAWVIKSIQGSCVNFFRKVQPSANW